MTGYDYRYWPIYHGTNKDCSINGAVNQRCVYVRRGKGKYQDYLGESYVMFVKYNLGDYEYTGIGSPCGLTTNSIRVKEIHQAFSLGELAFNKTIRIDEDCDCAEGRQPTHLYYSNKVGVVKKELIDSNQVWNLVNYHIEE